MTGNKLIIDCDGGIDDAVALIILIAAHKQKKIEIEAITCVNGNTIIENVIKNVFRILDACLMSDIPVFQGAYAPLLCTTDENIKKMTKDGYDGNDGFESTKVDTSPLKREHAVHTLNRIVSEHPNMVSVLCLGPLTNVALAIKMYPNFVNNVKELYIMGGNLQALENCTPEAEFNFYMDPESAHIVLSNSKKPLWLLPWDTCLKSCISHEWRRDVLGVIDKRCVRFINNVEYSCKKTKSEKDSRNYIVCDAILAAIYLKPEIATNIVPYYAEIELKDNTQRGVVKYNHLLNRIANVHLIEDFDLEVFKELLLYSVNAM